MRKVVSFLLQDLKIETDEVILHFVTEAKICALHKEFFDDPSPTDCITFPLDPPGQKKEVYHVLGEAFLCPKTAIAYAKRLGISPEEELLRYVVHCILHLIGYEDTEPSLRRKMKRKESSCLKKLKILLRQNAS
jgi:probable rRNA maturation factor